MLRIFYNCAKIDYTHKAYVSKQKRQGAFMQQSSIDNNFYVSLLKKEIVPALGCTEPIALAYAAAVAKKHLGSMPENIDVLVSGNIIKNVKSVIVPNTGGLRGIRISVLAGCLSEKPDSMLEVLNYIPEAAKKNLPSLKEKVNIKIEQQHGDDNLYIDITVRTGEESSRVIIRNKHTNIVKIQKNNTVLLDKTGEYETSSEDEQALHLMTFDSIYDFSLNGNIDELIDLLNMQLSYNKEVAMIGIKGEFGLSVGKMLLKKGESPEIMACAYAAAGSDARMSGCTSPVMINSGSGNQGMTLALPVYVYGEHLNLDHDRVLRGLALANLISIYVKSNIGTLSAFCGAVSAAAGAGAAITLFKGGSKKQVEDTIKNCMSNLPGVICDGAKPSCAYKIASSVQNAIWASDLALEGHVVEAGSGVILNSVDDTIKAIGRIGKSGMKQTDDVILDIMTHSD